MFVWEWCTVTALYYLSVWWHLISMYLYANKLVSSSSLNFWFLLMSDGGSRIPFNCAHDWMISSQILVWGWRHALITPFTLRSLTYIHLPLTLKGKQQYFKKNTQTNTHTHTHKCGNTSGNNSNIISLLMCWFVKATLWRLMRSHDCSLLRQSLGVLYPAVCDIFTFSHRLIAGSHIT